MRKGYLKTRFAVDVKTGQVVSMDVSSEMVGDGKRLVRRAQGTVRVRRVLGDGAYDQGELQLPRKGGDQASHQGGQELSGEEQWELRQEDGGHRAAGVQAGGWPRIHRFGHRWRVEGASLSSNASPGSTSPPGSSSTWRGRWRRRRPSTTGSFRRRRLAA